MKLVVGEPESDALRSWIAERPEQVASVVAAIEVRRAVLRSPAPADAVVSPLERADSLLGALGLMALDDKVVAAAGSVLPSTLRTLDAIHLATALTIPGLEALVTYDDRLGEAARASGIAVVQPGR